MKKKGITPLPGSVKVEALEPFYTGPHRVICKEPGEIITMKKEDYEGMDRITGRPIKELCVFLEDGDKVKTESISSGEEIEIKAEEG